MRISEYRYQKFKFRKTLVFEKDEIVVDYEAYFLMVKTRHPLWGLKWRFVPNPDKIKHDFLHKIFPGANLLPVKINEDNFFFFIHAQEPENLQTFELENPCIDFYIARRSTQSKNDIHALTSAYQKFSTLNPKNIVNLLLDTLRLGKIHIAERILISIGVKKPSISFKPLILQCIKDRNLDFFLLLIDYGLVNKENSTEYIELASCLSMPIAVKLRKLSGKLDQGSTSIRLSEIPKNVSKDARPSVLLEFCVLFLKVKIQRTLIQRIIPEN